ncbi:MAG: hypothetical protein IH892_09660 [Planctomycetes bacterium]|nr:hypothetical protein [Planctomycetota bacterium]
MTSSALLILKDRKGNGDQYTLQLPADMATWRIDGFLDFVTHGHAQRQQAGYLAQPADPLHFERLRLMLTKPEITFNRPITFAQHGHSLRSTDCFDLSQSVNVVSLDRCDDHDRPPLSAISTCQAGRRAFGSCQSQIIESFDQAFDFGIYPIRAQDSTPIETLAQLMGCFDEALDETNQLRFFYRVATLIHTLPFETMSKIQAGIQFRTGWEMWVMARQGWGGVCAEKTGMLKCVCDLLRVANHPVIGSESSIPDDISTLVQRYLESEGQEDLPIWIQHHILEVCLAGKRYLIDATGGNIPLLFLDEQDASAYFNGATRSRMVYRTERLHLSRVSEWVGDALLTLNQYHVPELHLQYIFKQGLGLSIGPSLFLGVYFDWGGERSNLQQNYYASLAKHAGFPYPRFIHPENLDAIPNENLRKQLENTLAALRVFYQNKNFTGDFTFVIQPILDNFWRRPRVTRAVWNCVQEMTTNGP